MTTLEVVAWGKDVSAAYDFIKAILTRDYGLFRGVERPQDQSPLVNPNEDPELHRHMMHKRASR